MTSLKAAFRRHWQAWTCVHGVSRFVCIADDLAHTLHLRVGWLCDLHDQRLTRSQS